MTAFVPSEMACLESSPGRMSRTEVWISRDEMVDFLLSERAYRVSDCIVERRRCEDVQEASLEASSAIRSKRSATKELRMSMALLEIPVSGWTCLRT